MDSSLSQLMNFGLLVFLSETILFASNKQHSKANLSYMYVYQRVNVGWLHKYF